MIQAARSSVQALEPHQRDESFSPRSATTESNFEHCIHHWFEAQVEQTPDAIALSFQHQELTYRSLNQRANQLAHCLLQQGLQPQELVVVSVERSLDMVIGFLAVLKAGGAYVPIDPAYPPQRRAYQLQDVQPRFILTQQHLVASLPPHQAMVLCLDTDEAFIASFSRTNPTLHTTAAQLAYVIYTSGSTGRPKGVMVPHRAVVNHSRAVIQAFALQPCDRVLQFSSMGFDVTVEQLYPALVTGATVVLRTEECISSTHHFLQFVAQHHITVLLLPVAFWHEWVNGMEVLQTSVPANVRLVAVGGEKPSRSLYERWRQLVGDVPRWLNGYGPTETTVTALLYDPIAAHYDSTQGEIPIGQPLANTEVYILNSDLQPVPLGECGELYLGGLGLAHGYLNLPDETAARFIANPFSPDPLARLYRTGDRVRQRPDGNLEFMGRFDFQVKLRGFRVELSEIEVQLEHYAPIQQAIVGVQSDSTGTPRLVAYLKLQPQQTLNSSDLRQFLRSHLPDYMLPTAFVLLDRFPLTPNGKVDRQALPAARLDVMGDREIEPPTNATERQLVQIWEDVLGLHPIGVTDNFFDLGGHSLLVARLADQIAQAWGVHLPLSMLLQAPTIAQLAAAIAQPLQRRSLVELRSGGTKAPLFLIHDGEGETLLYRTLAHRLNPDRSVYGIQPRSTAHHPILHTRIHEMAADYVQQIRAIQPAGPYYLGGLCAGGVLAYEVACQLQQAGQSVALVALLDAVYPALDRSPWLQAQRLERFSKAVNQAQPITLLGGIRKLAIVLNKIKNLLGYETQAFWQKHLDRVQLHLFRYYLDRQQTPPRFLRNLAVLKVYRFAEAAYRPTTRFDGHLLLLRATHGEDRDRPYQVMYDDPEFGWGQCTTRSVWVHDVPGGHSSMLQPPHVQVLADILQRYLDEGTQAGHC